MEPEECSPFFSRCRLKNARKEQAASAECARKESLRQSGCSSDRARECSFVGHTESDGFAERGSVSGRLDGD